MQALLELSGYTPYQATCLTPVLWALAAGMILCGVTGWLDERAKRRTYRHRHRRRKGR